MNRTLVRFAAERQECVMTCLFIDAYRDTHPDAEIDSFDLWDRPLPEILARELGRNF